MISFIIVFLFIFPHRLEPVTQNNLSQIRLKILLTSRILHIVIIVDKYSILIPFFFIVVKNIIRLYTILTLNDLFRNLWKMVIQSIFSSKNQT